MMALVKIEGTLLKYAEPPLNQDRDLLTAAGIASDIPSSVQSVRTRVILSERFSLERESSTFASEVLLELRKHWFFSQFDYYSPNDLCKGFCGVTTSADGQEDWSLVTSLAYECRGKCSQGKATSQSCWRFSFRQNQEACKDSSGYMIQVMEMSHNDTLSTHGKYAALFPGAYVEELGDGQKIEEVMAKEVGIKTFVLRQRDCLTEYACEKALVLPDDELTDDRPGEEHGRVVHIYEHDISKALASLAHEVQAWMRQQELTQCLHKLLSIRQSPRSCDSSVSLGVTNRRDADMEGWKQCLATLKAYAKNLADSPREPKYKKIKMGNKAFQSHILPHHGAVEVLDALGFRRQGDFLLHEEKLPDRSLVDYAINWIEGQL